jgi:uncharacterized membrane protein YoaK (UPF0700 family)
MNTEGILGIQLFNAQGVGHFILMFLINLFFATLIIRGIYYRTNKNPQYLFTFMISNILVFCVTMALADIKQKTGFAFGLFAVFSILRYRTEPIPIKEMTFLFVSIIVAVINALSRGGGSLTQLLLTNSLIAFSCYLLEKIWLKHYSTGMSITYEKIELLDPSRREELLADLQKRTGVVVKRFDIESMDFLRDTARIQIYY